LQTGLTRTMKMDKARLSLKRSIFLSHMKEKNVEIVPVDYVVCLSSLWSARG
jgi:hypothetical protein